MPTLNVLFFVNVLVCLLKLFSYKWQLGCYRINFQLKVREFFVGVFTCFNGLVVVLKKCACKYMQSTVLLNNLEIPAYDVCA